MTSAAAGGDATAGSSTNAPLVATRDGPVAILTLNRPAQRNALSEELVDMLGEAIAGAGADNTVRAIVVTGAPPAFCAGHDLKEMTAHRGDADGGRAWFEMLFGKCSATMAAIVRSPKPVIAAVEGIATAAGCQLVASCDMAIAGADARFATNGIDQGLFCSTPMVALTRNVPPKQAMEMLMTGRMVDATEAERIGLLTRVVAQGHALQGALEIAHAVAAKSPVAVSTGKQAFHRQREMSLEDAYGYTARLMAENMMAADAREGIAAFIEKREPVWRGE